MGEWKGTAPLSKRGDWSHGPLLQLKYNSHSAAKAEISDDDVERIGQAYSIAFEAARRAFEFASSVVFEKTFPTVGRGKLIEGSSKDFFEECFGKAPEYEIILLVMLRTYGGLKDNSQVIRLYLFDKQSKKDSGQGFVMKYPVSYKGRPVVNSHDGSKPGTGQPSVLMPGVKSRRESGHIHINFRLKLYDMTWTIVHEATHRFAGTGDFAYRDKAAYQTLTDAERVNNADSYAHFCELVYMAD